MGHHESLILLLVLKAMRTQNPLLAGVWWGLALAAKQTAVLALMPVFFLTLCDAWRRRGSAGRRGLVPLVALSAPAALIPLLLIAPFWLRWPREVTYSLAGVESYRILYGINIPTLIDAVTGRFWPAIQPGLNAFLVRFTSSLFLLLSAAFSFVIALRHSAPAPENERMRRVWRAPGLRVALIAAVAALYAGFLVFGKWSESHYRFMPLMLLLVLDLLEHPDFPYVYVLFALMASTFAFATELAGYWRLLVFGALMVYLVARAWSRAAVTQDVSVPEPRSPAGAIMRF
jgi:hypothetical protein